ncbi:FprA family A-type flavoprotein [Candidatus Poribacteria bacterium]|nr:FprA family A-type flavoprotein [Candidatus Poribacteria bacterium]
MSDIYKAVKVTDNVYWVGAIDWRSRDFHGYSTPRGSTYNAYLILADKVTLIDTVKKPFKDEMLARISSLIEPEKVDYIISNHSEMDHSGCLPETIKAIKPEKVFASSVGSKTLNLHFQMDTEIMPLKDGENLSLGNMDLTFMETKMLHWPDSMVTYLAEDSLLFSQDAFGMHMASSERFDDEIDWDTLEYESIKYYANILTPMSKLVLKVLDKLANSGLEIDIIAPDHGPIWRKNLDKIMELYKKWALQKPTCKAVVIYDTMWDSTALMARAIGEGITEGGASLKLLPLRATHRSNIVTDLLDAGAFVVGSPTINNNMFPTVADLLYYAKGLKFQNLIGAAFGSYGWTGEAVKHINEILEEMKVELVSDGIRARYVPDDEALGQCHELGKTIAQELLNKCNS